MSDEIDDEDEEPLDGLDHLDSEAPAGGSTTVAAEDKTKTPAGAAAPQSDELKTAIAELTRTVTASQKPKEPEAKVYSDAEKAELWGVFDPEKSNKEFFKQWFRMNPDATPEEVTQAKELFKFVQEGMVRQSLKGSQNLIAMAVEELRKELTPVKEYMSKQEMAQTRRTFFKEYPGLSDPKWAKIVSIHAAELGGQDFKDEKSFFKALAESAGETIKGFDPTFDLAAGKPTKSAGTPPKLPRTRVGGQGGAGGGAAVALSQKGDATDDFLADD